MRALIEQIKAERAKGGTCQDPAYIRKMETALLEVASFCDIAIKLDRGGYQIPSDVLAESIYEAIAEAST